MIKQVNNSKTFLDICDKLEFVKDCKLNKKVLYSYMIAGLYNGKTLTFASYGDKGEMSGCSVITINNDISGDLTLFVVFQWISPHYRKIWKKYMEFTEDKAKEYKCKKISFTTARSEKAIDRQMGKFGYKKIYNVIEKEVV